MGRRRTSKGDTVALSAQRIGEIAGFKVPDDRQFLMVEEEHIGKEWAFSREKLCVVLSLYRYSGFDQALAMVEQIFEVGGKGHSCGIYSHDDQHIDQLARMAPVSRIMVRQPQSKANAGSFTNGMPMTSSLGCGTWGGNITSENIHLKHYMNMTWVSRPIEEDRPSEQELFGEFMGLGLSRPTQGDDQVQRSPWPSRPCRQGWYAAQHKPWRHGFFFERLFVSDADR